ncbi:MAG: glucose-6-phosphate isomerase [Kangiellaceae bacterium]|nr:glucose-6-phosphate isomerase [Kangiellaceae bacterium]MCW8997315.1 glucose-6-phosphate isomerase [Kangiellaceae bacterium]MCW9016895.1 glucose-6-phosphate isomerase [Kangiellaceae bacterium]
MNTLTQSASWKSLWQHYSQIKNAHMKDMFKFDKARHQRFSINFEDMLFDFSKNRISKETLARLVDLAIEANLKSQIEAMFRGKNINTTEQRAALHGALRLNSSDVLMYRGQDINRDVQAELNRIEQLSEQLHAGEKLGFTGRPITDVVNIGIGGSDLGPKFVVSALKQYRQSNLNFHFISNVDPSQFNDVMEALNPATTLFIIASKSFTTQETMTNAQAAKEWFLAFVKQKRFMKKHFVAVSTNREEVIHFGISPINMFSFWDWVGGRYSLWSSIGLSIVLAIGMKNFNALRQGAKVMDDHFRYTPFAQNIPVIMGLLGVWYNNFFGFKTHAILPYNHRLDLLPQYLQQLEMESNGKSVTKTGGKIGYSTGPILWGSQGINGQHAFFQLLHQGSQTIPADFIACVLPESRQFEQQEVMLSNFVAQTEALMKGRSKEETIRLLRTKGLKEEDISAKLPHMIFDGNKPTNSILFRELTPRNLGMLIAMYEHKTFVQGVIWNINSFDQFGVELGKSLAKDVLSNFKMQKPSNLHDSSTTALIESCMHYLRSENNAQSG